MAKNTYYEPKKDTSKAACTICQGRMQRKDIELYNDLAYMYPTKDNFTFHGSNCDNCVATRLNKYEILNFHFYKKALEFMMFHNTWLCMIKTSISKQLNPMTQTSWNDNLKEYLAHKQHYITKCFKKYSEDTENVYFYLENYRRHMYRSILNKDIKDFNYAPIESFKVDISNYLQIVSRLKFRQMPQLKSRS